jgi:MYXO-CTERM domain-containing protein
VDARGEVEDWSADALHVFVGADAYASLRADPSRFASQGRALVVPSSRTMYPDVALVVLASALETPVARLRFGPIADGDDVDVVGFGLDRSGKRPPVRMRRDGLDVLQVGPGTSRVGETLHDGEFVFGEAACSGDSGGPAFSGTTGAVVGVASRVGNGSKPRSDDPSAFCVGERADDVYSGLLHVEGLVERAFAAAGAKPNLERPAIPRSGRLATAPLGDETQAAPVRATGGCSVVSIPDASSSPVTPPAAAVAFAVLALSSKRRRRERAPR